MATRLTPINSACSPTTLFTLATGLAARRATGAATGSIGLPRLTVASTLTICTYAVPTSAQAMLTTLSTSGTQSAVSPALKVVALPEPREQPLSGEVPSKHLPKRGD